MNKRILSILLFLPILSLAQTGAKMEMRKVSDAWIVNPKSFNQDFNLQIKNAEAPLPGAHVSKEQVKALKEKMNELYPRQEGVNVTRGGRTTDDTLRVLNQFPATQFTNEANMVGGRPNDNTLAISNDEKLLVAWNTQVWGYDMVADTYLFSFPIKHPTLFQFLNNYTDESLAAPAPFDPKLLYDPNRDRFILVYLVGGIPPPGVQGRLPESSATLVFFSSTNDPKDVWYGYELGGNPLSYETWTDYPQIAINNNSFYLTLNQLYPDSGWVEGFAETVLWQMDLDAAFAGEEDVPTKLWTGFTHDGKNIRYLHPIKTGMGPEGDDMYFIANRPFTTTNDTFFLVSVKGKADDTNEDIDIQLVPSELTYGHPPYALQSGGGQKFWTNDARILGGVRMGNEIQFTGNTIDTTTGKASIYHGVIEDIESPMVKGTVISGTDKELGFPNIDFIGVTENDHETAIFANHSAYNIDPGNSVIYYNYDREYSAVQTIKEGESYVDMINFGSEPENERWGDYSGIQRKFDATARIWVSGYWGFGSQRAGTWIAELGSPKDGPVGVDPVGEKPKMHLFPNPAMNMVSLEFEVDHNLEARLRVYDLNGRLVAELGQRNITKGKNALSFDAFTLDRGTYILSVEEEETQIFSQQFIKQ